MCNFVSSCSQGNIMSQGTYEELVASGVDFSAMLSEYEVERAPTIEASLASSAGLSKTKRRVCGSAQLSVESLTSSLVSVHLDGTEVGSRAIVCLFRARNRFVHSFYFLGREYAHPLTSSLVRSTYLHPMHIHPQPQNHPPSCLKSTFYLSFFPLIILFCCFTLFMFVVVYNCYPLLNAQDEIQHRADSCTSIRLICIYYDLK